MFGRINTGRKIREKEEEEEDVRAAGVFFGEGFLVFFWFFFKGIWKRRRIIYNLPAG